MNDTVKLQIRIDRELKQDAEAVFADLGLDAATAIRLFFTKVAKTRSIPFRLRAEPEFSPEIEKRILQAWEESKDPKNLLGPFETMKDLIAYMKQNPDGED